MKVKVIEAFSDKQTGANREVGDLFDCLEERAKELIGYKLVEKVGDSKEELAEKDLKTKQKALDEREAELVKREEAVKTSEEDLKKREAKISQAESNDKPKK